MQRLTSRERFLRTLRFLPVDMPFVVAPVAWQETQARWRGQGWDGRALEELFPVDRMLGVAAPYGPVPEFSYQLIEDDERTRVFRDRDGIVKREFKERSDTSMPQFVRFPVQTEGEFDCLVAERLELNAGERFTDEWKARVEAHRRTGLPRHCKASHWGGFFGPLRYLMGLEGFSLAFYDQPRLVERMMAQRADAIIAITREILKYTRFEVFGFWEDMACKHGSLIDPRLFRRLALPHYRRVCDWLHSHGVEHIWLDSDGDISELIPIWLDAGVNILYPFEVNAGMDVVGVRRRYGHNLVMKGGIDKRAVAEGGETMRREVDRVMPVVEDGGYIPDLDHHAPPDISWARLCDYMEYLLLRLGRG